MLSDVEAAIVEAQEMMGRDPTAAAVEDLAKRLGAATPVDAAEPLIAVRPSDPASASDDVGDPDGMRPVPAGLFKFGQEGETAELPKFWIDRYPVTNGQYAAFVVETGHRRPKYWANGRPQADKLTHPVVGVNQEDAAAYAAWAGKSLPSEREWEKAARGPDGRAYPWGNLFSPALANLAGSEIKDTTDVTRYEEGESPYGVVDMAGNTWEWTESTFRVGSDNLVLKGGSWYDFSTYARCDARFSAPADHEGTSVGFRCVYRGAGSVRIVALDGGEAAARLEALVPREHAVARALPDDDAPLSTERPAQVERFVASTVGALHDYDVDVARARVSEVFGAAEDDAPQPAAAIERPDVDPEEEMPLPEGRWRIMRPVTRALRPLVPRAYRVGNRVDGYFARVPRWVSAATIVFIPMSTLGLVIFSDDSKPVDERPAATVPAPPVDPKRDVVHLPSLEDLPARPRRPRPARRAKAPVKPAPTRPAPQVPSPAPVTTPPASTPPGMVYVPAGTFKFGAQGADRELKHAYFIDRYEVTNADYAKFVAATGYTPPKHWTKGEIPAGKERHPVTFVDVAAAKAYAAWVGKRLPSEEEWERAARGTDGRKFPWGDAIQPTYANLFQRNGRMLGTSAVGAHPAGRSPVGCDDMAGNVLEWTVTKTGTNYVLKGGSWGLARDGGATTFRYNFFAPTTATTIIGFRCVKDVD